MKTSVIEVREMLSVLTEDEVEKRIGEVPGVASVTVNYAARNATVRYDETRLEVADIKALIHQRGQQSAGESQAKGVNEDKPAVKPTPEAAPRAPPPSPPPAMAKTGGLDDPSVKNSDEVARALGADLENGLTSQEASRRLAQDGPNELRSAPRQPTWRRVLSHFQDPLEALRCSYSPAYSPASTRVRTRQARSPICSSTRGFGARSHCRRCCKWQSSTSPSSTLLSARCRSRSISGCCAWRWPAWCLVQRTAQVGESRFDASSSLSEIGCYVSAT